MEICVWNHRSSYHVISRKRQLILVQHAHRYFHLGVHVPFYLHFWGRTVHSNSSFGGTKKINCICSTQGRAPCCFFVNITQSWRKLFFSWPLCLSQCPSRKYYFVVVQLTIEIYSLPVSNANGIKFRFQFIKMSDRDLKFVYLFCQTDMFLFVIETPIGKCKHSFSKLVGTSTCKTWNIKTEIYYWAQK